MPGDYTEDVRYRSQQFSKQPESFAPRQYQPLLGGSIRLQALKGKADPTAKDFKLMRRYTQTQKMHEQIKIRSSREYQFRKNSVDKRYMRDIEKTNRLVDLTLQEEKQRLFESHRGSSSHKRYRSRLSGTTRSTNVETGNGVNSVPNLNGDAIHVTAAESREA